MAGSSAIQQGRTAAISVDKRRSLAAAATAPGYRAVRVEKGRHHFLASLFAALGEKAIEVWTDASVSTAKFDRAANGGLITALAECDDRQVAIVWSDFRVNGASYGHANSTRFADFLRYLRRTGEQIPLIYVVNSAGVSVMEGRTAFSPAFGIWPELLRCAEERLVLTCAVGRCLGLAPLLFALGHYRVAVADRTQVNLTGPDVLRRFFGRDCDFDQRASAERCVAQHDLIHELVQSTEAALLLFRRLLTPGAPLLHTPATAFAPLPAPELGPRTAAILRRIVDEMPQELVPGWCAKVRLFLGTRGGSPIGVFINPLEQPDNLVTVRTLDKYAAGLDLFRALRVPIVSVLDSPGIDPRFEQGDANNIRRIVAVGEKIIHYPHGCMAVAAGRCYGGATTLAFPKIFGGRRAVALRGAQIGVMDDRIVGRLLSASPRLRAQWQESVAARGREFRDLRSQGSLDAVVDLDELPSEIDRFLLETRNGAAASPLRVLAGGRSKHADERLEAAL